MFFYRGRAVSGFHILVVLPGSEGRMNEGPTNMVDGAATAAAIASLGLHQETVSDEPVDCLGDSTRRVGASRIWVRFVGSDDLDLSVIGLIDPLDPASEQNPHRLGCIVLVKAVGEPVRFDRLAWPMLPRLARLDRAGGASVACAVPSFEALGCSRSRGSSCSSREGVTASPYLRARRKWETVRF